MKVDIKQSAVDEAQRFGITRVAIEQALGSPDDVQEIKPEGNTTIPWPLIPLYLKRYAGEGEGYLLLVQTIRQGDTDVAESAWRVYPADLGVEDTARPLDVYKAFLNKYGMRLNTKSGITTLLLYQVFSPEIVVENGVRKQTFNIFEGSIGDEDRRVTQTPEVKNASIMRQVNGKMYVALACMLNLSNYLHDLAGHDAPSAS